MVTGNNFRIDGDTLCIFEVTAQKLHGDNWILSSANGTESGAESPVAGIDLMGRLDKVDGEVSAIVISPQVACELWLSSVIVANHFESATEQQYKGKKAIQLSAISLGCYTVPSVIICDGEGAYYIKLIA